MIKPAFVQALIFCLMFANAASGDGIMLINSDFSVKKYKAPHESFLESVDDTVFEIDLGKKKNRPARVEYMIYDEDPDIIYCIGAKAYLIAADYAEDAPIVFSSILNWMRLPAREKTYGVSNELHPGMEMMTCRYILPGVKRIGVLYSGRYTGQWFDSARQAAEMTGIDIAGVRIGSKDEVIPSLKIILPEIEAFRLIPDPAVMSGADDLFKIMERCDSAKTPVFSYHDAFAKYGALLTVSVDAPTIGRQAARIVNDLLAGSPVDDKVVYPAGSHVILNLEKTKKFGVSYSESALDSVNKVIE